MMGEMRLAVTVSTQHVDSETVRGMSLLATQKIVKLSFLSKTFRLSGTMRYGYLRLSIYWYTSGKTYVLV